jgi:hypothetical protein
MPGILYAGRGVCLFAALLDRDLGHEVAHLADRSLGIFLGRRFDHVLDLGARRIHRFELKCWHGKSWLSALSRQLSAKAVWLTAES